MTGAPIILVTGFGGFPGVPHNPCIEIIEHVQSHIQNLLGSVETLVLPVSYLKSINCLDVAIAQWKPDVIVELGVSSRAEGLKVESMAYNVRNARIPDVDGIHCTNQPITKDVSIGFSLNSTLPLIKIVERMSETVKTHHSTDPGRYVCNNIYWHTLYKYPEIPSVFVHVPMFTEANYQSVMNGVIKMLDTIVIVECLIPKYDTPSG